MNNIEKIQDSEQAQGMLSSEVKSRIEKGLAESTKKQYASTINRFKKMYPGTKTDAQILEYLALRMKEEKSVSTLKVELSALKALYRLSGKLNEQTIIMTEKMIAGYAREKGSFQKQARAIRVTELYKAVTPILGKNTTGLKTSTIHIRNKAIILIGYAGMFRRSELAALKWEDVEYDTGGIWITVRKSKTDQEGKGFKKWIGKASNEELCPIKALKEWEDVLRDANGQPIEDEQPVFCRIQKAGQMPNYVNKSKEEYYKAGEPYPLRVYQDRSSSKKPGGKAAKGRKAREEKEKQEHGLREDPSSKADKTIADYVFEGRTPFPIDEKEKNLFLF